MTKGILKKISRASKRINTFIKYKTNKNSLYSRGLSREGYDGGYLDCLSDIQLVLKGIEPCRHP